jgi:hypothetical protein
MVKVEVNLSLCLITYALCHEDIWESGGIAPPFLTSALDGGEWSTSHPGHFTPRGGPNTHYVESWVDPSAMPATAEYRETNLLLL